MTQVKTNTDIKQSKILAKILPIESADMTVPFTYIKNEYVPGHAVSRKYIEVYNDMIKLQGLDKEDVNNLIQPAWSLATLFNVLPAECECMSLEHINYGNNHKKYFMHYIGGENTKDYDNPIDACYEMVVRLHELKML